MIRSLKTLRRTNYRGMDVNKTAIRNFAVWARNKLIADVSYHAGLLGITKNGISKALPQSTKDVEFYDIGTAEPYAVRGEEIQQRRSLVDAIRAKEKDSNYETAYNNLIEEVAYTWFNRLIAIRFMEVNDYLPEHVRVLSSESGKQEPDIVTTPFDANLFFADIERQKIIRMKNDNKLDEVFRILFIKQCRELSAILPRLFEGTNDYTELLLSLSFIDKEGVVYHLVHDIPEDDFNVEKGGQVEIIGWLYQYYNAELKDETFALLKNNVKLTKERIPSATQLFTPDWIVRYMVENSLGRLWVEGHPNDLLKSGWKYYLDEAEQEPRVEEELEKIRLEYAKLNPKDIKVIDPCMGSGHILVYAFDVLMQIYENAGYTQRDAAKSILEHNLFGLDIDDRAAQLAYFAVMMKARQYNRRIFGVETNCNVYAIKESNNFDRESLVKLGDDLRPVAERVLDAFLDAKEYGSIISVDATLDELDALDKRLDEVERMSDYGNLLDMMYAGILCTELNALIKQARVMVQKYAVAVTNPPYMGNMNVKLGEYAKEYLSQYRYDSYSLFIWKLSKMISDSGLVSMVTGDSWLTLSSFAQMRKEIIRDFSYKSIVPLGSDSFEAGFGTVMFTFGKKTAGYKTLYCDLVEAQNKSEAIIMRDYGKNIDLYVHDNDVFLQSSGAEFVYPCTDKDLGIIYGNTLSSDLIPKAGLVAGNNDLYLRLWYEIEKNKMNKNALSMNDVSEYEWVPLHKGGGYRKWYGIHEYVIHLLRMFSDRQKNKAIRTGDPDFYFKEGITWSTLSNKFAVRKSPKGFTYNTKGSMCFPVDENKLDYYTALLNSKVSQYFIKIIAPNLDFNSGTVVKLPGKEERCDITSAIAVSCVRLAKEDWDSFETSWDFKKHPLI